MFSETIEAINDKELDKKYLETGSEEAADDLARKQKKKEGIEQKDQNEDIDKPAPQDAEKKIKTAEENPESILEKVKGQTAFIEDMLKQAWSKAEQQYLIATTGSSNTAEEKTKENKEAGLETKNITA